MYSDGSTAPPPRGQPAVSRPQKAHRSGTSAYAGALPHPNDVSPAGPGAEESKTPGGGGDGASHFCRPQPPSLEGGEGLHSSPGGQKRRRAASPGRATSLLSSSKECSRKETPVLCPLRGSLEAPHRVGVCVCTCGTATLSLSQVMCSRLKKVPLCVPSGRKAASCPALTEDGERWKLPQACCDLSGPHSSSGTPAQPKIPHLPPKAQSKASPSVPYKNRPPVLAQAAGAFLLRFSLDPTASGTGAPGDNSRRRGAKGTRHGPRSQSQSQQALL